MGSNVHGSALDTLETAMQHIAENPEKILDDTYMMNIFSEYIHELPPFKEYWTRTFETKQMAVIACKSGAKVFHYAMLRQQLFSPTRSTVMKTSHRVKELTKIAATTILTELHDTKKATNKYLSSSGSEYSWMHCSAARKTALLGTTATNDQAESTLGGCTAQIQKFGRISLSSAAAVSDLKRNGFFSRQPSKNNGNRKGIFHEYNENLRHAIVEVAMRDAPVTKERNNEDLKLQATARSVKEKMAKKKNMDKATEDYIEAAYLINMYDSAACIKDNPRNVKKILQKVKSKTAKYNALKTNITIRIKGFGWEWAHHAWSKNGKVYTVEKLTKHLEWIITEENKKNLKVPTRPKPKVPQRAVTGMLGTPTEDVATLDSKYMKGMGDFRDKASQMKQRREVTGDDSIYSRLQPFDKPEIESLIEKRIDYLFMFDKGASKEELCWCQGEVIAVSDNPNKPNRVTVCWDPMPNSNHYHESSTSSVDLLPTLWNKNREKAWRFDVDILVVDEGSQESEAGCESGSELESDSGSEDEDDN